MALTFFPTYSLKKSRDILKEVCLSYNNHSDSLSEGDLQWLEDKLEALDQAILKKHKRLASKLAKEIHPFAKEKFPSSRLKPLLEFIFALTIALLIAILFRQCWLELNTIPTGSMRPSFREQDQLIVSKTSYGLNFPMIPGHVYFDPELLQRGDVVTLTAENLSVPDVNTHYFWIIPYKKRYVKRLIGKPGDTLYFHGGKIYGIDKLGNPITEFLENSTFDNLEHIPFSSFYYLQSLWDQKDDLSKNQGPYYGIDLFASARLISAEQIQTIASQQASLFPKAIGFIELKHHFRFQNRYPMAQTSYIPIDSHNLDQIQKSLYTSRFEVKNERAKWIGGSLDRSKHPKFEGIADGRYEFFDGTAYNVSSWGKTTPLPPSHPLYASSFELIQHLFNHGITFNIANSPHRDPLGLVPTNRFAYFRNNDLYLMGHSVLKEGDPFLEDYLNQEAIKGKMSSTYLSFLPTPAPNAEGKWDVPLIQKYGIKIPDQHYMMLGDNHSMSGDSRMFGFVPEENIKGSPVAIFWPFGSRFFTSAHRSHSLLTLPNMVAWGIFSVFAGIIWYFYKKQKNRPLFNKKK